MVNFDFTAMDVYNVTTLLGAVEAAVKGVIINCTPRLVKFTILCSALGVNGGGVVATGFNPISISILINTMRLIVEA